MNLGVKNLSRGWWNIWKKVVMREGMCKLKIYKSKRSHLSSPKIPHSKRQWWGGKKKIRWSKGRWGLSWWSSRNLISNTLRRSLKVFLSHPRKLGNNLTNMRPTKLMRTEVFSKISSRRITRKLIFILRKMVEGRMRRWGYSPWLRIGNLWRLTQWKVVFPSRVLWKRIQAPKPWRKNKMQILNLFSSLLWDSRANYRNQQVLKSRLSLNYVNRSHLNRDSTDSFTTHINPLIQKVFTFV